MALMNDTSSFVFDGRLNGYLSPFGPWLLCHDLPLDSGLPLPRGVLVPESPAEFSCSSGQFGLGSSDNWNGHKIPDGFTSTMSPEFANLYEPTRSHFPSMGIWSDTSLPLLAGYPNDVTEADIPYRTLALDMAPKPPNMQQALDLIPGFSGSTAGYHTNVVTELDTLPPENSMLVSSSSPFGTTEEHSNFVDDEMQTPVMLSRLPEKKRSRRRYRQRACAINIQGLWIDKDDLYSGARKGAGTIGVHECQWARSTDPCGMWIIGTRFSVGAHIRKWHTTSRANRMAPCLWHGCVTSKPMLRDSFNRHIVTVHLGEGFHCRGCNQEFSRKDVYDRHVRKDGLCQEAGAAMVYGTERRVIDICDVLRRGGAARFAD